MRAIILAAGRGGRLEANGLTVPKCLLELGGVTLLERHLRNLAALGVADVRVCVGYRSDMIAAELARSPCGGDVSTTTNPDYLEGSIVSLWTMREGLSDGADVLLMDADVLYAPRILERLAGSRHASCLLVDRDFTPGEEPVKVCLDRGHVVELRKQIAADLRYDACGESVGFFKLDAAQAHALAARAEAYVAMGRRAEPHEEALRDVILADPDAYGIEDVTGLPWIEIDFPDDVARARDTILPRLDER